LGEYPPGKLTSPGKLASPLVLAPVASKDVDLSPWNPQSEPNVFTSVYLPGKLAPVSALVELAVREVAPAGLPAANNTTPQGVRLVGELKQRSECPRKMC